jgi:hypothetical protein
MGLAQTKLFQGSDYAGEALQFAKWINYKLVNGGNGSTGFNYGLCGLQPPWQPL